jgi:hypothetical protein
MNGGNQVAVTVKHKKARIFRDFLISTNGVDMFKEDEVENAVLFRSAYPITEEEKKQFVVIIDDTVYVTMQALIVKDVNPEKKGALLEVINQIHTEHPTVKYVITKEGQLMTSMVFHAHDKNMDPSLILRCILEFFKVVGANHYGRFMEIING